MTLKILEREQKVRLLADSWLRLRVCSEAGGPWPHLLAAALSTPLLPGMAVSEGQGLRAGAMAQEDMKACCSVGHGKATGTQITTTE